MTDTMINRIAKVIDPVAWETLAIYARVKELEDPADLEALKAKSIPVQRSLVRAIAAVQAMPTALTAEIKAAGAESIDCRPSEAEAVFNAMLDAILSEHQRGST